MLEYKVIKIHEVDYEDQTIYYTIKVEPEKPAPKIVEFPVHKSERESVSPLLALVA